MWRFCASALAVLMLLPAARAQEEANTKAQEAKKAQAAEEQQAEPQTPAEQYAALEGEYRKAVNEFMAKYRALTDNAERAKMAQEYPKIANDFADKFLELQKAHPDDPAGERAMMWIFRYAGSTEAAGTAAAAVLKSVAEDPKSPTALNKLSMIASTRIPQAKEAKDMLVEYFVNDDQLSRICFSLDNDSLRKVIEKTENRSVKGHAMTALGRALLGRPVRPNKEGEELLAKVVEEYGDIDSFRGKLSGLAEGPLFELRHLQIGMVAPNIEGADVDDEPFQLTDYRGKVTVIDFWGDW